MRVKLNNNYTYVDKNIYRTESGSYRVRVKGYSENTKTLKEAKRYRKLFRDSAKSTSIF